MRPLRRGRAPRQCDAEHRILGDLRASARQSQARRGRSGRLDRVGDRRRVVCDLRADPAGPAPPRRRGRGRHGAGASARSVESHPGDAGAARPAGRPGHRTGVLRVGGADRGSLRQGGPASRRSRLWRAAGLLGRGRRARQPDLRAAARSASGNHVERRHAGGRPRLSRLLGGAGPRRGLRGGAARRHRQRRAVGVGDQRGAASHSRARCLGG